MDPAPGKKSKAAMTERRDFFISYTSQDLAWAQWIAAQIDAEGHSTLMQSVDFHPGVDWVHEMHKAVDGTDRVIIVLSAAYLRSEHGAAEWRAAYRRDPSGELRILVPVRVEDVKPPGLLATRTYIDLAGQSEETAKRLLLEGLFPSTRQKAVPTYPNEAAFPGPVLAAAQPGRDPAEQSALDDYLNALRSSCDALPYFPARNAADSLARVYVSPVIEEVGYESGSQQSTPSFQSVRRGRDAAGASPLIPSADIFNRHRHFIIEAPPGMGKSSFLNYTALRLAEQHLSGTGQPHGDGRLPYPVRIYARSIARLAGTFPSCLRNAVLTELGGRLTSDLDLDFFGRAQAPGHDWLVLIDALDEIVDRKSQYQLVSTLAHLAAIPGSLYRFVVTTRPVREGLSTDRLLSAGFGHYRILPFADEQQEQFVKAWFGHLGGSAQSSTLLSLRSGAEVGDLLRTPLILTMAAIIYQRDRALNLPSRPAGLYERFLRLLDEEEADRGTLRDFRRIGDQRYGRDGEHWADALFSRRRQLIEHLALCRQDSPGCRLLDEATSYLMADWLKSHHDQLDKQWARDQAGILLTRSGLMAVDRGLHEFVHETVREYLAASALLGLAPAPDDARSREFIGQFANVRWRQIALFAIGIWSEREIDVTALLRELSATEDGLIFVAVATSEGALVDDDFQRYVVQRLAARLAKMSWGEVLFSYPNLMGLLVSCRNREAVTSELLKLARDGAVDGRIRVYAARKLEEVAPGAHVLELLTGFLADTGEDATVRQSAALLLATVGDADTALPFLTENVADANAPMTVRIEAAEVLGQHGDVAAMLRFGRDRALPPRVRERAAVVLARLSQAADAALIFADLAEDGDVDARVRERALHGLLQCQAGSILGKIARNGAVEAWLRERGARLLAHEHSRAEGCTILSGLALDPSADDRVRARAVASLEEAGEVALLDEITMSPTVTDLLRVQAAAALIQLGSAQRAVTVVRQFVQAAECDPQVRQQAAAALARAGFAADAADVLMTLIRVGATPAWVREQSVTILRSIGAADKLLQLSEDTRVPVWLRVSALSALRDLTAYPGQDLDRALRAVARLAGDGGQSDDWVRQRVDSLLAAGTGFQMPGGGQLPSGDPDLDRRGGSRHARDQLEPLG
jgi:TIR domain